MWTTGDGFWSQRPATTPNPLANITSAATTDQPSLIIGGFSDEGDGATELLGIGNNGFDEVGGAITGSHGSSASPAARAES